MMLNSKTLLPSKKNYADIIVAISEKRKLFYGSLIGCSCSDGKSCTCLTTDYCIFLGDLFSRRLDKKNTVKQKKDEIFKGLTCETAIDKNYLSYNNAYAHSSKKSLNSILRKGSFVVVIEFCAVLEQAYIGRFNRKKKMLRYIYSYFSNSKFGAFKEYHKFNSFRKKAAQIEEETRGKDEIVTLEVFRDFCCKEYHDTFKSRVEEQSYYNEFLKTLITLIDFAKTSNNEAIQLKDAILTPYMFLSK